MLGVTSAPKLGLPCTCHQGEGGYVGATPGLDEVQTLMCKEMAKA